jgi:RecB family endonuclease NucS
MLFTYNKQDKNIIVYEETDFKTHNIFERQNIEKWVEDNPEILGEELLVLTTEYDKFDKTNERIDLLALDKRGTLVIVELKRDDSGKTVELQAVKYAAYCSTLTITDVLKLYVD